MTYIAVIILLLILTIRYELFNSEELVNTAWYSLLLIIFVFIAGLRDGLGVDTKQYDNFFTKVPVISELTSSFFETTRFRPGFVILVSLCKSIIDNFVFFQFIESLIVNGIIFYFIRKNSSYPYMTILLYFIINYLEFNMEIQREAIAVSLVLLAWCKWTQNKKIFAFLFFSVATTFHISCLIAIIFPLINVIKFNKKWMILAITSIITIPLIYFAIPNLPNIISILLHSNDESLIGIYSTQEYNNSLNTNAYLIHFIQYSIVICGYIITKKFHKDQYAGFVLIYMIFMYMSTISYGFYRFSNYYSIFYIIFMANFIICLCKKYTYAKSIPLLSCIIMLAYLTYYHENKLLIYDNMNKQYNYENYIPYNSILNSI